MSRVGALLVWLICLIASPLILIVQFLQASFGSINRAVNMAIGLDQTVNVLLGGWPDETISARAHRCSWRKTERFINWLFRDIEHCQRSFESEVNLSHFPSSYKEAS